MTFRLDPILEPCANRYYGTAGNDTIDGSVGGDWIYSEAGDDLLRGWKGRDCLTAGDGNDVLKAGIGADRAAGMAGNDRIWGGIGRDRLSGGSGNDWFRSLDLAPDTVSCGSGIDEVIADRRDTVARDCENVNRRGR